MGLTTSRSVKLSYTDALDLALLVSVASLSTSLIVASGVSLVTYQVGGTQNVIFVL